MLLKSILAVAVFAASAAAQAVLAFTQTPGAVQAGQPTTISWTGGTGGSVTITLKKGDPNNLQTVLVITGNASGNTFNWTPPSTLTNGNDYALSISQGVSTINYSGQFSVSGGSGTNSGTSSGPATYAATTTGSAYSTLPPYYTTSAPLLTAPSASGTGTTLARNTTFSSPTLSSTTLAAATTTTVGRTSGASSSAAGPSSTGGAPMGVQVQGALGAGALAAALFYL